MLKRRVPTHAGAADAAPYPAHAFLQARGGACARTAQTAAQAARTTLLAPALALFSALTLAALPAAAQEARPEAVQPSSTAAGSSADGPEAWVRQLRDKDAKVRQAAGDSLVKAGEAAVKPLIASIEGNKTRDTAWGILAAIGPKAVAGLIGLLKDPGLQVRAGGALFVMIDPRSSDQAPALLACAREAEVKNYCLQSLVKAMGPKARKQAPLLIEALADPDADVRIHAAAALGAVGPKAQGGVEALIKALGDGDPGVRVMSAQVLGKMGRKAKAARAALQESAEKDANEAVRRAAGRALEASRG